MPNLVRTLLVATLISPLPPLAAQTAPTRADPPPTEAIVTLEKFVASERNDDPNYLLPVQPVESSFGFC